LGLQLVPAPPLPVASWEEARRIYLLRKAEGVSSQIFLPDDPVLSDAVHAWTVERRREGAEARDEYDGIIGLPLDPTTRVFSASQLTVLGQCPFKWFSHKVLKLVELEEADEELNPGVKGQLYHRSLELAFSKVLDVADLRQAGLAELENAFLQAEQDVKLPNLTAWHTRRGEHIEVLRRAIVQTDFLQPEAEIVCLEQQFESELYGLKVSGRVDRVDRTPQGLVVIDYKTSSTKPLGIKDESGKANLDLQLPLYAHVIQTTLFPEQSVDSAYYYSLSRGKKLYKTKPSEETLQAIAQKVKDYLQTGHYPVEPDIDQNVCKFCPYDLVCRRGNRLNRKGD
jgi:RecB family exonuclease